MRAPLTRRVGRIVEDELLACRRHPFAAVLAVLVVVFVVRALVAEIPSLAAPIMAAHDWRQAHTFAPAYNFVHESANFFFPRINDREHHSGIIGMETPVFAYAVSLAFRVFGDGVVVARTVAFLVTAIGFVSLGRTIARAESRLHVLGYAGWLALSPMVLCESRCVQPDASSCALMMLAASAFYRYGNLERRRDYLVGLAFAIFGVLTKASVVCILPALWLFTIGPRRAFVSWRTIKLGAPIAVVPFVLAVAWYEWARVLTYRYADGLFKFGIELKLNTVLHNLRSLQLRDNYFRFVVAHYATCWALLPAVLVGVVFAVTKRHRAVGVPMLAWAAGVIAFDLVNGDRLVSHWYYAMPLAAPLAYFGGLGLAKAFAFASAPRRCELIDTWGAVVVLAGFAVAIALALPRPVLPRGDKALALVNQPVFALARGTWWLFGLAPLAAVLAVAVRALRDRIPRWLPFALTALLTLRLFALGQRDALAMLDYHAGTPAGWRAMAKEEAAMRASLDEWSTRKDTFVGMSWGNPILFHRAERTGFLPLSMQDAKILTMRYFTQRGARFLLVASREEALALAPVGPELARGDAWLLYCLDPAGCPRRTP